MNKQRHENNYGFSNLIKDRMDRPFVESAWLAAFWLFLQWGFISGFHQWN